MRAVHCGHPAPFPLSPYSLHVRACAFVRVCVCVFVRVREREMATHSSQSCALRVMRSIVQCGEREGAQGVDGDEKEVREREK